MFDRNVCKLVPCLFCLSLLFWAGCSETAVSPQKTEKAPPPIVVVDKVAQEDVMIYTYASGRTVPSNSVEVRARVSGYLEKLFFQPGAIVQKGDPLALIEQATYQIALDAAKADLTNAKSRASLAKLELERTKSLVAASGPMTLSELESDQSDYEVALATVDLTDSAVRNAELNLHYTTLQAPISGKTTKNLVDIGNFVSPTGAQAVLLSIAQLDPMFVEFELSDRKFTDLKDRSGFREAFDKVIAGQDAQTNQDNQTTETDNADNAPSGNSSLALTGTPVDISLMTGADIFDFNFNIPGKIVASVSDRIKFDTAQITLRAEIKNPLLKTKDGEDYLIYAGQSCRVRIPDEKVEDAVLVKEGSILTDLDTKYVLVVEKRMFQPTNPDGSPVLGSDGQPEKPYETDVVVRKDIVLGKLLDSQMRIVLGGVEPGESYIVHGVQRVRIGIEAKPITLAEYEAELGISEAAEENK